MLDRRVTIIPIEFKDTLCEFEKLLCNPGYAQWRVAKVHEEVDTQDLTNLETIWFAFLEKVMNDQKMAAKFIFPYLNVQTGHSDSDRKELVAFARRLLQKRPEYADQVRDLLE